MNKAKILSTLCKIFKNVSKAINDLFKITSATFRTASDIITNTKRYDVDIYRKTSGKPDEQFDRKINISYKQVLQILKSMEVFPDISIVVSKHNRDIIDL